MAQTNSNRENPFISILFNILIPVMILNKSDQWFGEQQGALIALVIALLFPLCYGLIDYVRRKKKNFVSLLGIINILFTGGLALAHPEGIWFAVKEAAFPALIGTFTFFSAYTEKPAIKMLAFNPEILRTELIEAKITEQNQQIQLKRILKNASLLFAISFFISSALNFILALRIFKPIDAALGPGQRSIILNEQIAEMTWMGYVVIAAPLILFLFGIIYYLFSNLSKLSGLTLNEMLPHRD